MNVRTELLLCSRALGIGLLLSLVSQFLPSPALAQSGSAGAIAAEVFGAAEWRIESIVQDGTPVPINAAVSTSLVLLSDPPALGGTVGCNRATARFTLGEEPGSIAFGPVMSTMMACPEPAMSQEQATFSALELIDHYQLNAGRVVLSGPGVEIVLAPVMAGNGSGNGQNHDFTAFNSAVTNASAAGAAWTGEPLRVALALVDLYGAPQATVTLSSAAGEPASAENSDAVVVTIVEQGLADDSLAGVTQRISLQRVESYWLVSGHETVWQCRRGPDAELTEPARCP